MKKNVGQTCFPPTTTSLHHFALTPLDCLAFFWAGYGLGGIGQAPCARRPGAHQLLRILLNGRAQVLVRGAQPRVPGVRGPRHGDPNGGFSR